MIEERLARERLEEILNREEYHIYYVDNRNSLQVWRDNIMTWLGDLLSRLFPGLENTTGTAGNFVIGLLIVAIIILVIVFLVFFLKFRKKRLIKEKQPFHSENDLEWTYHQHFNEAKEYEAKEDYSLAARHLFLGLLLFFHEKEWLEAKIWKTNWEYYEELRKVKKDRAELFFHFALLFDRTTYGKQKVTEEEYIPFRDQTLAWLNENLENDNEAK